MGLFLGLFPGSYMYFLATGCQKVHLNFRYTLVIVT